MSTKTTYEGNELLSRIADGDERAFEALLRQVLPMLEGLVFKVVKAEDSVKEILQETMVRIWMNRDKLPSLEKPLPWIKRVALNETFTWLNKQARRVGIPDAAGAEPGSSPDITSDPLMLKETQRILAKAIETMPPQRKRIYQMSRQEGMKPSEIAAQLNLSEGYVKNALTAALEFLRERLVRAGKFMLIAWLITYELPYLRDAAGEPPAMFREK